MLLAIFSTLLGAGAILALTDTDDDTPAADTDGTNPDPANPNAYWGTNGNDSIDAGNSSEAVEYFLQDGADRLEAGSGDDTIHTGDGYNMIQAGAGNDIVNAGPGGNQIWGQEGDDTLNGGAGNDQIYDLEGENLIDGAAGSDHISASGGSTVTGGTGGDTFSFSIDLDTDSPVVVTDFDPAEDRISQIYLTTAGTEGHDLTVSGRDDGQGADIYHGARHIATVLGAESGDLDGVEVIFDVTGPEYSDQSGDAFIRGSEQAQLINGGDGDDLMRGGMNLGTGGDSLFGGTGDDTISAIGASSAEFSDGAGSTGQVLENSELDGGAGDDTLVSTNANILTGGEGADTFGLSQINYHGLISVDPTDITDFDPDEDVIVIESEYLQLGGSFSIEVWEDGTGSNILVGDQVIARVTGGQSLTLGDLTIAEFSLERTLLGYH